MNYKLDPTKTMPGATKDIFDTISEDNLFIEARCKEKDCRRPWAWRKTKMMAEEIRALREKLSHVGFICPSCLAKQGRDRALKNMEQEWAEPKKTNPDYFNN